MIALFFSYFMNKFLNLDVAISLFAIRPISSCNLIILWLFLKSFLLCLIYGICILYDDFLFYFHGTEGTDALRAS